MDKPNDKGLSVIIMAKKLKTIEEEIKKARESSTMIEEQIKKLEEREEIPVVLKKVGEPKEEKPEEFKIEVIELEKEIKKEKKPEKELKPEEVEKPKEEEVKPEKKTEKPKEEKPKEKVKEEVEEVIKAAVEKGTVRIDTTVKEVMITDVKTAKPRDSLRKVLNLLSEYKITGVPVIHDHQVVGIISDSDIIKIMDVRNILDPQKDEIKISELEKIPVNEAMTKEVILINEKEKITDASELMYKHHINRLPVVDNKNNLVGIVTREDIIKGITSEFLVKSVEAGEVKIIETKIDQLIRLVEKNGSIPIPDLSRKLKVHPEQIERWARILEEHGIIEILYPTIGPPKLRKKK